MITYLKRRGFMSSSLSTQQELILKMLGLRNLFGLLMQPKKHLVTPEIYELLVTAYDVNIIDEWLKEEGAKFKDAISRFSDNVNKILTEDGERIQNFRNALARLIKSSLRTGEFVEGEKGDMELFLTNNPDVTKFLSENIDMLREADKQLKEYIARKGIKILPAMQIRTEAQKRYAADYLLHKRSAAPKISQGKLLRTPTPTTGEKPIPDHSIHESEPGLYKRVVGSKRSALPTRTMDAQIKVSMNSDPYINVYVSVPEAGLTYRA
jgi:hypothetical protein